VSPMGLVTGAGQRPTESFRSPATILRNQSNPLAQPSRGTAAKLPLFVTSASFEIRDKGLRRAPGTLRILPPLWLRHLHPPTEFLTQPNQRRAARIAAAKARGLTAPRAARRLGTNHTAS
jgi:hypothetical protein